jgi:malonyl-CoA O-methyltransferase
MADTPPKPALTPPTLRALDLGRVVLALRRLATQVQPPWLHQEVARRMVERLPWIKLQPAALLDWWAFGGASQALLAQTYPAAQRWCLEPTPELRARAKAACPAAQPQRWWSRAAKATDVQVLAPQEVQAGSVQLVWANMMLHAVADPPRTLAAWHQALAVDGFVMFSCLGPGTLRELAALYQRLAWPAPMAEFVDMHDIGDMLVRAGFADPVMDQETLTLSWPDAPALLQELRSLGGNAAPTRFAGLRTPRWHAQLLLALESLRSPQDGRIALRFEVAYGHAFKVAPRIPMAQETSVSLADMKALVRGK